jgi:replicative DNA helicase
MSRIQLAYRLFCSEAKVDSSRLRSGYLRPETDDDEGDWIRLARAMVKLGELPVYIDDSADITALEMRSKCRRLMAEHGLGLIVVDYLQLVRAHGRSENRNQEISLIARSLKTLARELNVPVIALSQLSRLVERRDDKRPLLSDLRESGSIEAEADIVMMLYRDSYYPRAHGGESPKQLPEAASSASLPANSSVPRATASTSPAPTAPAPARRDDSQEDRAELIVAKHRNGPTGIIRLSFLRRYASFQNLAEEYAGQEPPY